MMDCTTILAQLSDYVDGTLAAQMCAELESHLAECPDCRAVVDSFRKTVLLYRRCEPDALPEDVRERLYKVLHLEEGDEPRVSTHGVA